MTSRAGMSGILAQVTEYALERELHDHNKVSCNVKCCLWRNCFLSYMYVCDVGLWFRFRKYGSMWHKQNLDKIK